MQYLIQLPCDIPFLTKWYDYANHYVSGMIVYDLVNYKYTTDGENWKTLQIDHL